MIIIIVNYNRPNFLSVQIPLVLKNLEPECIHVINTGEQNNMCGTIAYDYGCKYTYIKGPTDYSKSHAIALNVGYSFNRQDHDIIGILDHDCFPIAPINIKSNMVGKYFFASNQERLGVLYPNPACLFIDTKVGALDFMPCAGMDTGGQIHSVYNYVRQMAYSKESDYEMFAGAFLHIIKGSNWVGTQDNAERVEKVFEYVRTFAP